MKYVFNFIWISLLLVLSISCVPESEGEDRLAANLKTYGKLYAENPDDLDNLIWYGRFLAYNGSMDSAIQVYTNGLQKYPEEPRILRHRGHRYISQRKFDLAINDLERASLLIRGKENSIEADGMPNGKGIPVSTTHGNIWYHLGLAYYLTGQHEKSLSAYINGLSTGTLDDNVVSVTHWIYSNCLKLGLLEQGKSFLRPITAEMDIIENQAYHDLCLFYKGAITEQELMSRQGDGPSGDAVRYGLGNWHFHMGDREKGIDMWQEMLKNGPSNSFGYIAAEVENNRLNQE